MRCSSYFEQWNKLRILEKFILRTCCYLPPKERSSSVKKREFRELSHYQQVYQRAFGAQFWDQIRGKTVLDFGCGYGEYVLAMAAKEVGAAIGVDILKNALLGERKAKELGLTNTKFIIGSSHSIPSNSIDVITSHDAFEHFENPASILDEMVRLVKPGGLIYIKFGPTWMSPWGRHMSGTFRKDRPWIHLIFPEKSIMRVHSVYHNEEELLERYAQRAGGLNQMTVKRCYQLVQANPNISVEHFEVIMLYGLNLLKPFPFLNELFSNAVSMRLKVNY